MGQFIVIAGGGTGGHVFPALAVAAELKRRDPSRDILFIGSERGIETRLVPSAGFRLMTLRLGGISGMPAGVRLLSALRAGGAVLRCLAFFLKRRPAAVMGVGGFASGPAALAALALRIPTLIQEQNAVPGITNRWLGRFVDRIALSFPGSEDRFRGRGAVTGNPVREAFNTIPPYTGPSGRLRLLLLGGSRGARTINRAATGALDHLEPVRERFSMVLQTGEAEHGAAEAACRRPGFETEVIPFIDDMPARLVAADLVVCRAGAGTIFELAAAGRASVLVPFPHAAGRHQDQNASWMVRSGAAIVVADTDLTGERLARIVRETLEAPESLAFRAAAARTLARPRAAADIASMAEELMRGERP